MSVLFSAVVTSEREGKDGGREEGGRKERGGEGEEDETGRTEEKLDEGGIAMGVVLFGTLFRYPPSEQLCDVVRV